MLDFEVTHRFEVFQIWCPLVQRYRTRASGSTDQCLHLTFHPSALSSFRPLPTRPLFHVLSPGPPRRVTNGRGARVMDDEGGCGAILLLPMTFVCGPSGNLLGSGVGHELKNCGSDEGEDAEAWDRSTGQDFLRMRLSRSDIMCLRPKYSDLRFPGTFGRKSVLNARHYVLILTDEISWKIHCVRDGYLWFLR